MSKHPHLDSTIYIAGVLGFVATVVWSVVTVAWWTPLLAIPLWIAVRSFAHAVNYDRRNESYSSPCGRRHRAGETRTQLMFSGVVARHTPLFSVLKGEA